MAFNLLQMGAGRQKELCWVPKGSLQGLWRFEVLLGCVFQTSFLEDCDKSIRISLLVHVWYSRIRGRILFLLPPGAEPWVVLAEQAVWGGCRFISPCVLW